MKALIERIKTWWREVERRQLHRRVRLYYEAGHTSRGVTARLD
jgi:hypothetical protein